jgi:hypothetical protein
MNPNTTEDLFDIDTKNPTVLSAKVTGPNAITIVYSESVTSVIGDYSDLILTPGGPRTITGISGSGTATIVLTFDGAPVVTSATATIDISSPVDVAGNSVAAINNLAILDGQSPTVTLTSVAPNPVWTTFSVTATFSEPVSGLLATEISVANGAASNLAGGSSVYTFDVAPSVPGLVSVSIPAGVAQDAATNLNTVSNTLTRTFTPLSFGVGGFKQPIDNPVSTTLPANVVKGGSTVPVKFEIFQGSVEQTSTALVESIKFTTPIACSEPTSASVIDEFGTSGGTVLRYSADPDGFFIDNWKTPTIYKDKCTDLKVTIIGGATLTAHFKFK